MFRKKVYILELIVIAVFSSVASGQVNRSNCTSNLIKNFTNKIVKNSKTLYVMNKKYLIEPYFDDECSLVQINVSKSARWNNLDKNNIQEQDSFLTSKEYIKLLAQIDNEYPLGKVLDSDKIGLSSPNGTVSWGQRQNSYIQITSLSTKADNKIFSFTIYFAHEVYGELGSKFLFDQPGFIKKAKLEVDEKLYWSDESTFLSGNLNELGTFKVFGAAQ